MGMNVSIASNRQLENYLILKNVAKNILNKNVNQEATQRIIDKALFSADSELKNLYSNSQLTVLKASTQITLNKLNKRDFSKKISKHNFGEIWNEYTSIESMDFNTEKDLEMYNFSFDYKAKNIFAA